MTKDECIIILEKFIEKINAMDANKEVFVEVDDNSGGSYCCYVDEFRVEEGMFGIFITNC